MAKHLPSSIWLFRRLGKWPNGSVFTTDIHHICIEYKYAPGYGWHRMEMTRADARLLAKRINECLEKTK